MFSISTLADNGTLIHSTGLRRGKEREEKGGREREREHERNEVG